MIPVLTNEEAYKLDKDTIESGHLSQEQLMDNAGKAVAQFFCEKIDNPFNQKVVVVCGKGNNGGDGVITHHYLKKYNVPSEIVFIEQKHGHTNLIKKYKISKNDYSIYADNIKFDKYDWIIDGIFGIGLSRELDGKYKKIIKNLNKNKNIISIDITSGLFTDSNQSEYSINSKHVITFACPKLGHFLNPAESLHIRDIGFKEYPFSKFQLLENTDIKKIVKKNAFKSDIHKYSKGETLIIAGSPIYPGAGILAARASQVSGSGYTRLILEGSRNLIDKINIAIPEVVVEENLITEGEPYANELGYDAPILYGPGGVSDGSLRQIYEEAVYPIRQYVFDASAFSYVKGLAELPGRSILTPHLGELQSITGDLCDNGISYDVLEILSKDIGNRILILKMFNTFIITENQIYIMDKGPSLLATAGTGDVLSGILVSLLSQGYSRLEASILGTYLHAEAANYYMNNISKDGMTASDLIDCIPHAFNKLREKSVN